MPKAMELPPDDVISLGSRDPSKSPRSSECDRESGPEDVRTSGPGVPTCFCCNKVLTKPEIESCKRDHLKLMCEEEGTSGR